MKNKKPRITLIIIILVVLIIVVPMIIHVLFKMHPTNQFFSAEWGAGDVLQFYGTILAALGAIIGVFLTVRYSIHQYQDDIKKRVMPFLSLTALMSKNGYNPFYDAMTDNTFYLSDDKAEDDNTSNDNQTYVEYRLERIYFEISEKEIKVYAKEPDSLHNVLSKRGCNWIRNEKGIQILKHTSYFSMPMLLENVGLGPAVNLRIGLNQQSTTPKYVEPIQLKSGQPFYIHIYGYEFGPPEGRDYELSMVYRDIYNNHYRQDYKITINNTTFSMSHEAIQKEL